MKLGTQLLIASTLTLALPVFAFRAVHQLDAALRQERADDQLERVLAGKALLSASGELDKLNDEPSNLRIAGLPAVVTEFYAERIEHQIFLDGYKDDWVGLQQPPVPFPFAQGQRIKQLSGDSDAFKEKDNIVSTAGEQAAGDDSIDLQAAVTATHLFLFIRVADDKLVFHDPSKGLVGTGDQIDVLWQPLGSDSNELKLRHFSPVATGAMTARYYGERFEGLQPVLTDSSARASLVTVSNGYQVEIRLPRLAENGVFAISVIDRDQPDNNVQPGGEFTENSRDYRWAGTLNPASRDQITGFVVYPSNSLRQTLADVVPAGSRLRVFDRDGRLRTDVNRLYEYNTASGLIDPRRSSLFNAILYRFFEWIIRSRQPQTLDPFTPEVPYLLAESENETTTKPLIYKTYANDHVSGLLQAVAGNRDNQAFLLFETNEDRSNAFTSSALVRVFSTLTLFSLLVAGSLLLFASWLSLRIRRLSNQAREVVSTEGRFVSDVQSSSRQDEIGELSRDFAKLVERSRGYTQYLEGLSSRLSHELRTPLSVVQTSLENIDLAELDNNNRTLVTRAQGGSSQLSRLLRSMSEAARLEQSITQAEFTRIDLRDWLASLSASYQSIYTDYSVTHKLHGNFAVARVVPELLQQAVDKLISNAVDFSTDRGEIRIALTAYPGNQRYTLTVGNEGRQLGSSLLDSLFEPMVSDRSGDKHVNPVGNKVVPDNPSDGLPDSSNARAREAPHLGLGLYIVRLVAESHAGQPFAENTPTGVRIGFHFQSVPD